MRYIELLEKCLERKAVLDLQPMQKGDVPATCADVSALQAAVGYRPSTSVEAGIPRFVDWYRSYYKV
jgi:UDP-glucuronate 4-epimerase